MDDGVSYPLLFSVLRYHLAYPLTPRMFLPLFLRVSLNLDGRDLLEIPHFELNVLRFLTICTLSNCGSLHLFPYVIMRSFSDECCV